jgi:putative SOS response-associated peptidase YedK
MNRLTAAAPLGETEGNVETLLRPTAENVLRIWLVDKKVGNVKNDGPELLDEPQPLPELALEPSPAPNPA